MIGNGWYVVQAHHRKEEFVRERIEELGREVFLPLVKERRPGRRRFRTGPLFPGYLFARLSENEGDFPRVRWAPGVRRLLGDGSRPQPLGDEVVDCIRAQSDGDGRVRFGRRLRRGARVRIVDGPLAGLFGVLEKSAHTPEQRVSVLLELFHRPTRVEVPAEVVWGQES